MRLVLTSCLALAASTAAAQSITRAVEDRYNRLRSLKVQFEERVSYGGRTRRAEQGVLYLLRPGRMRWEYTEPAGKLFVADGKMFHLYSPHSNQVQRLRPRDAADWRAPLAFLLGRLDFSKEFGPITIRPGEERIELIARPRSERDPFTQVLFHVDPKTREIRQVQVTGRDNMVTEFVFRNETTNPPLDAQMFRFEPPAGAEIVHAVP
jgi:outer membrane lipoprotein carrier protein